MRNGKFDNAKTNGVLKLLDKAVRTHGLPLVKHAATKWSNTQRAKARISKQKSALEKELAELNRKLSR